VRAVKAFTGTRRGPCPQQGDGVVTNDGGGRQGHLERAVKVREAAVGNFVDPELQALGVERQKPLHATRQTDQ
jgi:hypothetical protein